MTLGGKILEFGSNEASQDQLVISRYHAIPRQALRLKSFLTPRLMHKQKAARSSRTSLSRGLVLQPGAPKDANKSSIDAARFKSPALTSKLAKRTLVNV